MSDTNTNQLHKEFELERMILFSDAVFAIAITLLIIEIKFPEIHDVAHTDITLLFKPVLLEASGFLVSFIFIGMAWVSHLKLFRFLRAYNDGIIFRNLLMLFFVVTFPFSASSLTHYKPNFPLPILIYFANVTLVFIANFLLAHYMLKRKPSLTLPGNDAEKIFIYRRSKALALAFPLAFIIVLLTVIFSHNDDESIRMGFYGAIAVMVLVNLWIKRQKPRSLKT